MFNLSGNIPVMRDWFMIKRSGLISAGDRNFKSCVEIPSWPDDVLVRSEFNVFLMHHHQSTENWKKIRRIFSCIFVRSVTLIFLYYVLVKFGPMFIKQSLNILAIFLVINTFPVNAYFLYANMIVLLLVNNFRYGIPHFVHIGSIFVDVEETT